MKRRLLVLCAVLLTSHGANAHTRSQSASDWQMAGNRIEGSYSVDSRRATLLYGEDGAEGEEIGNLLAAHVAQTVHIAQGGRRCAPIGMPLRLPATEGYERLGMVFECPARLSEHCVEITIGALFQYSATHLHIIRVRSDGELVFEGILTGDSNSVSVLADTGARDPLGHITEFIKAGAEHVLSGWDHLAFLAALLLLAGRLKPMILTVTGFTVGHSLTMALVALGLLRPHALAVEVLIGFSIAYAAMEAGAGELTARMRFALWSAVAGVGALLALGALGLGQTSAPVFALLGVCLFVFSQSIRTAERNGTGLWRGPLLAVLFGLAHGAGFAGALLDYDLEGAGVLLALLGFNLGVEIGQLAAVIIILTLTLGLARFLSLELKGLSTPAAAALFGLGVFWTISRLLTPL